ncbi:MAG TPA: ankyrin repeat domain-containing protein [Solirubrobacteraceae bacterium]|nr:ankyrin repeat domain-containing protein [Solirubrobacteraceae bacterium]
MTTDPLPSAPSLEQLRKRAKDLLRAHRGGDPDAHARVAAHHPRARRELKLSDAQLVIAREHGFPSWPRLRAYADRVAAHGRDLEHAFHDDLGYYEGRAFGLLASAGDGTPAAVAVLERFGAPQTDAGARTAIARMHGFASWAALRRHIAELARDGGEPFARAYRAVEAHDLDALRAQLDRFPDLVAARGTNGNDLLNMATATCDERTVRLLLDRGADPARANAHGWTPLHQAAYVGLPTLAAILLDAGAPVAAEARGDGGTPLVVALFWGHAQTAELLADRGGVRPDNLRTAAGLGDVARIERLAGTPGAGAHRGFYRPHSGFPPWQPADDPQEVLDEALSWAARSDRVEALGPLVARGADPNADVYRGTALAWAAAGGRARAIRRLVELGADPNRGATFGGSQHGEGVTALHLAAQTGQIEAIRALLDAGADPSVRDALHDGTPADWAAHGGHEEARALLATAPRPGA